MLEAYDIAKRMTSGPEPTNHDIYHGILALHEHALRNNKGGESPDPSLIFDEYNITFAGVLQTVVILTPQIENPVIIDTINYSIPATATGSLQIGNRYYPLTDQDSGKGSLGGRIILYKNDTITLTSSIAGVLFVEAMGLVTRRDVRWNRV